MIKTKKCKVLRQFRLSIHSISVLIMRRSVRGERIQSDLAGEHVRHDESSVAACLGIIRAMIR